MVLQKKVLDFCKKNKMDCKVEFRLLDVISELGELSKEVLKSSNYGQKSNIECNIDFVLEFGDVLFALISLANELGVDINEALDMALKKYEQRLVEYTTC